VVCGLGADYFDSVFVLLEVGGIYGRLAVCQLTPLVIALMVSVSTSQPYCSVRMFSIRWTVQPRNHNRRTNSAMLVCLFSGIAM